MVEEEGDLKSDDGGITWYYLVGDRQVFLSKEEVAGVNAKLGLKCGALGNDVRRPEMPTGLKCDESCWNKGTFYKCSLGSLVSTVIVVFLLVLYK